VETVELAGLDQYQILATANTRKEKMRKYRVSLEVDKEWIKNFNLTFDATDEQDAEAQAMVEVKMNLSDYITAYADEDE